VLLVSIDAGYHPQRRITDSVKSKAASILEKTKVRWPNAFDPTGWDGVLGTFNAKGYGLIFVDGAGIVRGSAIHEKEVEKLLEKYGPKAAEPGVVPPPPSIKP
jgi:hypothetical protein